MTTTDEFTINEWFNDLPIRIIGTPITPFFYATDIGAVLGMTNIRKTIAGFNEVDIVSEEQRKDLGLVTYKIHKGKRVRDDKITLLTEFGVYKLIMISRVPRAEPFQIFICKKIQEVRLAEVQKLKVLTSQVEENKKYKELAIMRKKELKLYRALTPMLFVYKIESATRETVPRDDIDHDFCNYDEAMGKTIYKYTTKPNNYDRESLTLYCTCAVVLDDVFSELN
jgi:prophage antirepressor-like protein